MGMNNSARREQLYGLLGELPPRHRPVTSRTLSTEQRDGYVLEHLELDLNGIEPVPAVFVRPAQIRALLRSFFLTTPTAASIRSVRPNCSRVPLT